MDLDVKYCFICHLKVQKNEKTQELKILYFRSNYFFTRVVETTDAHFVIVPDNNNFDFLTGLRGYHV